MTEPIFPDFRIETGGVRGHLHNAGAARGIVLAHGAGANSEAPLIRAMAAALAGAGFAVLRIDLPFRQQRPTGPPFPAFAARDREGLREALHVLRPHVAGGGALYLGGHSYGGRQSTMLAAEDPGVAAALLLLSYPLHPPRQPENLRIAHFPALRTPALFVHGARDPFGSIAEMEAHIKQIPAPVRLMAIEGAGHDLKGKKGSASPAGIAAAFVSFIGA